MARREIKTKVELIVDFEGREKLDQAIAKMKAVEQFDASKAAGKISAAATKEQQKIAAMMKRSELELAKEVAKIREKGLVDEKRDRLRAKDRLVATEHRTKLQAAAREKAAEKRLTADIVKIRERGIVRSISSISRDKERAMRRESADQRRAARELERIQRQAHQEVRRRYREKERMERQLMAIRKRGDREVARVKRQAHQQEKRELREMERAHKANMRERARMAKDRSKFRSKVAGGVQNAAQSSRFVAGAAVTAGGLALKDYLEMSRGIDEIMTLNPKATRSEIEGLVKKAMMEFGQALPDATKSIYDIISAGYNEFNDTQRVFESAAKLAVAGVTDVATSADGLTSVLNAFQMGGTRSDDVIDQFFRSVELGKTTVDQMARAIGKVAPAVSSIGMDPRQMFAIMAQVTKSGVDTQSAASGLAQAISNIKKPTSQAIEAAKKLEIDIGTEALLKDPEGFIGFLKKMQASPEFNLGLKSKIFSDKEGEVIVDTLMNSLKNAEGFDSMITQQNDSKGAATVAFDKMMSGESMEAQKVQREFQVVIIELGKSILPLAKDIMPDIKEGLGWLRERLNDPEFREGLVSWTKFLAKGFIALQILGVMTKLGGAVTFATEAAGILGGAFGGSAGLSAIATATGTAIAGVAAPALAVGTALAFLTQALKTSAADIKGYNNAEAEGEDMFQEALRSGDLERAQEIAEQNKERVERDREDYSIFTAAGDFFTGQYGSRKKFFDDQEDDVQSQMDRVKLAIEMEKDTGKSFAQLYKEQFGPQYSKELENLANKWEAPNQIQTLASTVELPSPEQGLEFRSEKYEKMTTIKEVTEKQAPRQDGRLRVSVDIRNNNPQASLSWSGPGTEFFESDQQMGMVMP